MKHETAALILITLPLLTACKPDSPRFQIATSNNVVYRVDTQTGEVVGGWLGKEESRLIIPAAIHSKQQEMQ